MTRDAYFHDFIPGSPIRLSGRAAARHAQGLWRGLTDEDIDTVYVDGATHVFPLWQADENFNPTKQKLWDVLHNNFLPNFWPIFEHWSDYLSDSEEFSTLVEAALACRENLFEEEGRFGPNIEQVFSRNCFQAVRNSVKPYLGTQTGPNTQQLTQCVLGFLISPNGNAMPYFLKPGRHDRRDMLRLIDQYLDQEDLKDRELKKGKVLFQVELFLPTLNRLPREMEELPDMLPLSE